MNRFLVTLTNLLLLFTSYQAFSFQNIDKLLADPNVTWVGEVYVDYASNANITDPENEAIKKNYGNLDYNTFEVLKIQNKVVEDRLSPVPALLADKFFQFNDKNLNVYEDADLKKKISHQAYQKIIHQEIVDTVITFDPDTYRQIIKIVISEIQPNNIEQFRVKQILSYNAKTNQLTINLLAIAPIQSVHSDSYLYRKVLFWVPVQEAFKTINLDDPSISWAKRFTKDIAIEKIKTIKGTKKLSNIFEDLMIGYRAAPSTAKVFHQNNKSKQLVALTLEEVKNVGLVFDTVVSFHPETLEEVIKVVDNSYTSIHFKKIRILQDWAWDESTQSVQLRVVNFSPILKQMDSTDNPQAYQYYPLFYVQPTP